MKRRKIPDQFASVGVKRAILAVAGFSLVSCGEAARLHSKADQVVFDTKELRESIKALEDADRATARKLDETLKNTHGIEKSIQVATVPAEELARRQRLSDADKAAVTQLKAWIRDYREQYLNN